MARSGSMRRRARVSTTGESFRSSIGAGKAAAAAKAYSLLSRRSSTGATCARRCSTRLELPNEQRDLPPPARSLPRRDAGAGRGARTGGGGVSIKPLYEFDDERRQRIVKMHLEMPRGGEVT